VKNYIWLAWDYLNKEPLNILPELTLKRDKSLLTIPLKILRLLKHFFIYKLPDDQQADNHNQPAA
jgi:hypothetical protein